MPQGLRSRVIAKLGESIRVTVDDERSQLRNRVLARERIQARIDAAGHVPKARRPTKPSRGAKKRRLEAKRHRGDVKRGRRKPRFDD